ncbi:hypothetical protein QTN25_008666 [Entamoeba marina]
MSSLNTSSLTQGIESNGSVCPGLEGDHNINLMNEVNRETVDYLQHVIEHVNTFVAGSTRKLDDIENMLNLLELKVKSIESNEETKSNEASMTTK